MERGNAVESEPGAGSADGTRGWAEGTLFQALSRAVMLAVAFLLAVATLALLITPSTAHARWWLLPLHAVLIAGALAAASGRLAGGLVATAAGALVVVDWAVGSDGTESPTTLVTLWLVYFLIFVPALMSGVRARLAAVYLGLAVPALMILVQLDWANRISIPVSVIGVTWGAWTLLPRLLTLAAALDADLDRSWREHTAAMAARTASRAVVEQARMLHDTAINTMAALASGGAATADVALVRDRCRRDVETLDAIIEGTPIDSRLRLGVIAAEAGLLVTRTGLDDVALAKVMAEIPQEVNAAIVGAMSEAMQNVAKHAAAPAVEVRAQVDVGVLDLEVRDHGVGFAAEFPRGRGLAESVLGRSDDVGVKASVHSQPGSGTAVRLQYELPPRPQHADGQDHSTGRAADGPPASEVVGQLNGRASWLWSGGVLGIGLLIEPFSRGLVLRPVYGMLAIGAAVTVLARLSLRTRYSLPWWVSALLIVSTPAMWILAVVGTVFGSDNPMAVQALGPTLPMVLLLVHGRGFRPFILAVGSLVVAAAAVTVVIAQGDTQGAAFLSIGIAPTLALVCGWVIFQDVLSRLSTRAADAHSIAAEARAERLAREAAGLANTRWRHAGIVSSVDVLRRVSDGSCSPDAPEVRNACAVEEEFLRRVCLLDPDLFRLGDHFAASLALARERGVHLTVRSGGSDVESHETARSLGSLLRGVVAVAPAGATVVASLLGGPRELTFRLVGPKRAVHTTVSGLAVPDGWRATAGTYGSEALVEVIRTS